MGVEAAGFAAAEAVVGGFGVGVVGDDAVTVSLLRGVRDDHRAHVGAARAHRHIALLSVPHLRHSLLRLVHVRLVLLVLVLKAHLASGQLNEAFALLSCRRLVCTFIKRKVICLRTGEHQAKALLWRDYLPELADLPACDAHLL